MSTRDAPQEPPPSEPPPLRAGGPPTPGWWWWVRTDSPFPDMVRAIRLVDGITVQVFPGGTRYKARDLAPARWYPIPLPPQEP